MWDLIAHIFPLREMAFLNWSFICGVITGTTAYVTLEWIHNRMLEKSQINDSIDDCILFWPKALTQSCLNKKSNQCNHFSCPNCNFNKFLALLKSAKKTLDVCVYLITSEDITNVIVNLFKNGVFVRIIIDKQMSDEAHNSKIFVFLKQHIPIKIVNSDYMMHNKFVIIDQKRVVTGSFNWTRQGTSFNYENGVIIHNAKIVKKFSDYFLNVWHSS